MPLSLPLTLRVKENWLVLEPLVALRVYFPVSFSKGCLSVSVLSYL